MNRNMTANELDQKVMEYVHRYDVTPVLPQLINLYLENIEEK